MSNKLNEPDHPRNAAEIEIAAAQVTALSHPAERLLHELEVHQVELQMQNETLRQTQIVLEESRDRYVDFYDFAPAGYITLSREGMIAEINLTGATLLGEERHNLLNRRFSFFVSQQDRDRWYRHFIYALKHDSKQTCELEIVRKDGACIYVQLDSLRLEKDSKASVVRITLTDITARKMAELALKESMQKLEEKEMAKTRFLAAAGHDLRQPVTAASLFLHALKLTSPSEQQSTLIDKLDESMRTFADLLEQLLDISKFDAGLIKPKLAAVDLADVFDWLEQNFIPDAVDRYLRFRFYFPLGKKMIVKTDIGLLKSVLMNLVSNALKFTSHGGILVSARVRSNKVMLQVWDTGIGIDEVSRARIFDEFYQVANPQRNRGAGLGLGLSICKRTLSVLGSEVSCRSIVGRGSVFTFSLQLSVEQSHVDHLLPGNTLDDAKNELFVQDKKIVVVEDDDLVASGLVSLLCGLGAEVRHFSNAEEALRQDDASADCYIVDYALGGELTGLNLLVALQQRQHKPISAVVITGETSSQFMRNVADSPWPILHKPINFKKLAACLRASFDWETDLAPRVSHQPRGGLQ